MPMNKNSSAESETIPRAKFRTDLLPQEERFGIWRESVLPLFDSAPADEAALQAFYAEVESFNLQQTFLAMSAFSPLRFKRERVYSAGEDHLLVQLYLSGGYAGYNGSRAMRVGAGDISLLDLGQSLQTRAQESNVLSLVIPRELMAEQIGRRPLRYGTVLRAGSPLAQILASHLLTIWRSLPDASVEQLSALNRMLLGTVAGAFGGDDAAAADEQPVLEQARLDAICDYIKRNLGNDGLTPAELSRRFACSRAQLYRMFAPLGGVAAFIREARLARCFEELSGCNGSRRRIIDVALAAGFSSQSHFCRSFRAAYNIGPRDAIELGRAQRRLDAVRDRISEGARPRFHHWLRQL